MVSQETQESQAKDSQANGRALESKGNPSHQQNGKQEALTERELEERLVKTIEPPDGGRPLETPVLYIAYSCRI